MKFKRVLFFLFIFIFISMGFAQSNQEAGQDNTNQQTAEIQHINSSTGERTFEEFNIGEKVNVSASDRICISTEEGLCEPLHQVVSIQPGSITFLKSGGNINLKEGETKIVCTSGCSKIRLEKVWEETTYKGSDPESGAAEVGNQGKATIKVIREESSEDKPKGEESDDNNQQDSEYTYNVEWGKPVRLSNPGTYNLPNNQQVIIHNWGSLATTGQGHVKFYVINQYGNRAPRRGGFYGVTEGESTENSDNLRKPNSFTLYFCTEKNSENTRNQLVFTQEKTENPCIATQNQETTEETEENTNQQQPEIQTDKETITTKEQITIKGTVPDSYSKEYRIVIKKPSGPTVKEKTKTETQFTITYTPENNAETGEYTAEILPVSSGVIDSLANSLGSIVADNPKTTFTVNKQEQPEWIKYCKNQGYGNQQISLKQKASCIKEEMIPKYFKTKTPPENTQPANSICQKLLSQTLKGQYTYSSEQTGCVRN